MTIKEAQQYKAQYALDCVKQSSVDKVALSNLKGFGYMVPFYGAALSGRDTGNSFVKMLLNMRFGNKSKAGWNALGTLGNGAMTLADFLPFVGSGARGALGVSRVAKGSKGLSRFLRGNKALKTRNYFNAFRGAKPAGGLLSYLKTPGMSLSGAVQGQISKHAPNVSKFIADKGLTWGKAQGAGILPATLGNFLG